MIVEVLVVGAFGSILVAVGRIVEVVRFGMNVVIKVFV